MLALNSRVFCRKTAIIWTRLRANKLVGVRTRPSSTSSSFVMDHFTEHGRGFYSEHTPTGCAVVSKAIPAMVEAVTSVPVPSGSVFTIADYGTADGGVSMPLMYACVKKLRERHGDELPIHVIYEDQPTNDFLSLFKRLQGLIPGPPSFLLDFPNVYATACGTSFYNQCLPSNSVTVGFSSIAAHWLRDLPCHATDTLIHNLITVPEEKEKFCQQAEKDWELYLLRRAAELKPGGKMINVELLEKENGEFPGYTKGKIKFHQFLLDTWEGMAKDNIITQKEYHKVMFAACYRTIEEHRKPFELKESPVRKAGLELVSIETTTTPCLYHEKWMKEKGDAKAHAQWYSLGAARRLTNKLFISALSNTRTDDEKTSIVDELFNRHAEGVAKNPDNHTLDYVTATIVTAKRE